ncbi:MAG: hypothetical protein A2516_08120 [Alphaproteobacteria bacterium RIFOXYD12_FULL_60_8]|nr:MAG: hypothetical protein A2516_08120 [Alphaproteobacteria bacterium RIFOXYD12_FULL_60_8]
MRRIAPFLSLAVALLASFPVRAEGELVADLSEHLVAITTGFSGAKVLLFGATDGPGDVIMVVRGPSESPVVRRKDNSTGIWMNQDHVTFQGAPSFYQIAASRPLADFAPPDILENHQIGIENVRLDVSEQTADATRLEDFRNSFLRLKQNAGLFGKELASIDILGNRLFRANLNFPSNVPVGAYSVEVYLVREGQVVSAEITPLHISKAGVGAEVSQFAYDYAAFYGIISVLIAVAAGWLASAFFRRA